MTTPAGLPAWARSAGIGDYGGSTTKADYQGQGVVNPNTDVSAAQLMRLADHVAALTRTAPFAVLNITGDDATPGPPTVNYVWMMTGVCTVSYVGNAPPAGFPSAARIADGHVRITFAATYADAYGVSVSTNIRMTKCTANEAGNILAVSDSVPGSLVDVDVRTFTANTGAAALSQTFTLTVW